MAEPALTFPRNGTPRDTLFDACANVDVFQCSPQHRGHGGGTSSNAPSRSSHLLKAIYEQNTLLLNQVSNGWR